MTRIEFTPDQKKRLVEIINNWHDVYLEYFKKSGVIDIKMFSSSKNSLLEMIDGRVLKLIKIG